MFSKVLYIVIIIVISVSHGSKIFIGGMYHPAHYGPVLRLSEEMASRNHSVVFVTDAFTRELIAKDVNIIYFDNALPKDQVNEVMLKIQQGPSNLPIFVNMLSQMWENQAEVLIPLLEKEKPDIVVADHATLGLVVAARKLRIPLVLNRALMLSYPESLNHGIQLDAYFPTMNAGFPLHKTFLQRVKAAAMRIITYYIYKFLVQPTTSSFYESHGLSFSNRIPPPVIINTAFGFEVPVHLPSHAFMTGPLIDDTKSYGSLSTDLSHWLNSHNEIIYISFGTTLSLTQSQVDIILETIESINKSVLWSLPSIQHELLPKQLPNILHIETFVPQLTVLNHTNVKVFVSTCGVTSVQESLYFGQPIVCIPSIYDTFDATQRLVEAKAGISVPLAQLNTADLTNAINQLVTNNTYKYNALAVRKIYKTSGGLKRAGDIVEMIIQSGSERFYSPNYTENYFQIYNYDIDFIVISLFSLVVFIVIKLCRRCKKNIKPKIL